MSDLDQLDIMRRAITALGLGQCAPEELVAEAQASSSRREEARRLLSDANVRIKDLESALRDLGVNPGGDLPGEVRTITNRIAGDSAAAQHDLDCALRERDAAKAKIASNVAEAAARDMRIAELGRDLSAKFDSLKTAYAALNEICRIVEWGTPACPYDAVEGVRNRMAIGEGTIARAEQAEEHRNRLNQRLETISLALDDAGAPKVYNLEDDTERGIPDPERIRLLGERVRALRAQLREATDATTYLDAIIEAHNALDALGAPRLADGTALTAAARIRAIPQ